MVSIRSELEDRNLLRRFGQLVGAVFLVIGCWPVVMRGGEVRGWALWAGGTLSLLGTVAPRTLAYPYLFWVGAGHALAWVNTRVILAIIFFGVITPVGVIRSLWATPTVSKSFAPTMDTYRVARPTRKRSHMRHQF